LKGGFDKEALKNKYLNKAKAQERAFLASLSDLDNDIDDDRSSSPSSDDESERKHKDKLTGLCFVTGSTHRGFCTMAVDNKVKASKDVLPGDDDTTEVKPTVDALVAKLDIMTDTLVSQDKFLKRVARERKEFNYKLEITQKELEKAKKLAVVVSDEVECDECAVHMSNLSELQSKYVALFDENDELKSRFRLLGACRSCSGLQSELVEKNAKISALEKASSDSTVVAKCARCESLVLELESCRHNDDTTKVKPTVDALVAKLDITTDTLVSQDKFLKRVAHERKEFNYKLEITQKELEKAKKLVVVVSDEVECDECAIHMSNLSELQSKYVALFDENDELKSRFHLLDACRSYSGLQSELVEKNAKISALEKASSDSTVVAKCARCESLVLELESCRHDKIRTEEDNTHLRSILCWVSCNEPQLGMMMS
jgi:predicted neuraminidase